MKVSQLRFENGAWSDTIVGNSTDCPELVLCFGNKELLVEHLCTNQLLHKFPKALIVSSSTAGEIHNSAIYDNTAVATCIKFVKGSSVVGKKVNVLNFENSFDAGKALAQEFSQDNLRFLLIISDGQVVNGADLVLGIHSVIEPVIPVSGGLAGDGPHFSSTLVGLNDNIEKGNIVAVGFYGEDLQIGIGSKGGWGKFGPMRTITKSEKNVLYEIDGGNALDLYMKYLGDYSTQLPSSALLFPLAILEENEGTLGQKEIVRTILNVDTVEKSMTFAGNMPEGAKVRLMKANLDDLAAASSDAADLTGYSNDHSDDALALLISCIGRKLIFGNRIDEELEAAREILGNDIIITGFYSYGEIAPFSTYMKCELHNQTMTITTISEK
jgi:hypothetical protein